MCIDDETVPGEVSWFQGCISLFAIVIVAGVVIASMVVLGSL